MLRILLLGEEMTPFSTFPVTCSWCTEIEMRSGCGKQDTVNSLSKTIAFPNSIVAIEEFFSFMRSI